MKVFKIKEIQKSTGISKKELKKILMNLGVITASWAVKDDRGLVVELYKYKTKHTETTLLITEAFVLLLLEIANAREYRNICSEHEEEVKDV